MKAAAAGQQIDPAERAEAERAEAQAPGRRGRGSPGGARPGLDVVSDGEQTETGFFAYIGERMSGFEPGRVAIRWRDSGPKSTASPSTTSRTSKGDMAGGMAAPAVPLGCGPGTVGAS